MSERILPRELRPKRKKERKHPNPDKEANKGDRRKGRGGGSRIHR